MISIKLNITAAIELVINIHQIKTNTTIPCNHQNSIVGDDLNEFQLSIVA